MNDQNETDFMPGLVSITGAIGVLAVYWFHLFLMEIPLTDGTGLSLTVFISTFVAQYIPLKTAESKYRMQERNQRSTR